MLFFGLGGLFYGKSVFGSLPQPLLTLAVSVLLVNAIAILSEDRFLARSELEHFLQSKSSSVLRLKSNM